MLNISSINIMKTNLQIECNTHQKSITVIQREQCMS